MKILMLTPYVPYPPASGGQIRSYNLLKYLKNNNEVTLISLYKKEEEKKYVKNLRPLCKEIYLCKRPSKPWQISNIFKATFSWWPFLVVRNFSPEARKLVAKLLKEEKYDIIHVETFYIMPHIPKTNIPILLVEQTIEFKVYLHFIQNLFWPLRFLLYLDIFKIKYWEKFYWQQAKVVSAVSNIDKEIIQSVDKRINPIVSPNGAGDDMFVKQIPKKNFKQPKLLFVGNFSWLQNVEAAEFIYKQILPQLHNDLQNFEIIIAGQEARTKLQHFKNSQVNLVDIATNDTKTVQKLYQESTIFIAPIFGPGGTRLKILAAMASGLPVVSSAVGVEGLEIIPDLHVCIANNPKEFVKHIQKLLTDSKYYYQVQNASYQLACEKYSWSNIAKNLENIYYKTVKLKIK